MLLTKLYTWQRTMYCRVHLHRDTSCNVQGQIAHEQGLLGTGGTRQGQIAYVQGQILHEQGQTRTGGTDKNWWDTSRTDSMYIQGQIMTDKTYKGTQGTCTVTHTCRGNRSMFYFKLLVLLDIFHS